MSNPSLWALAIHLWNGARAGEEKGETALDFLTSCRIKKTVGGPFLPDKGLVHTQLPGVRLRVRDSPRVNPPSPSPVTPG